MTPKTLEPTSKYASYDLDQDGVVTDSEMSRSKEMLELELREEKSEAQKQMAWVAMMAMIGFSAA